MIPGARLIILGRQGAGKGTQCVRLARHYVVPHISTGDVLRAAVREGTREEKAADELNSTTRRVSEIAQSVGFTDPTVFSRAFKNWTGQSPQEYRRTHKSAS